MRGMQTIVCLGFCRCKMQFAGTPVLSVHLRDVLCMRSSRLIVQSVQSLRCCRRSAKMSQPQAGSQTAEEIGTGVKCHDKTAWRATNHSGSRFTRVAVFCGASVGVPRSQQCMLSIDAELPLGLFHRHCLKRRRFDNDRQLSRLHGGSTSRLYRPMLLSSI